MKRITFTAVLALALLMGAATQANANGLGGFGIAPGHFSIGVGLNVSWGYLGFGQAPGNWGHGPCYGPGCHQGPAMYDAYGYGGMVDYSGYNGYGYGNYNGYYGGGYGGYYGGGSGVPVGNGTPAPKDGAPKVENKGK